MTNDEPNVASVLGIDPKPVTEWICARLPHLDPPIQFVRLAGGNSNLTFRCEDRTGNVCVLRRPPLGHILATAHDMAREHRIVCALAQSAVPVPVTHGLCEDKAVNGAAFYLMEFVPGIVLLGPDAVQSVPQTERAKLSEHVVRVLADLHLTDIDTVGLGDLARKDAFLARQLKRWTTQWEASKTEEVPEMDEAAKLLEANMPEQIGAAIVHGDYRLGNMLVADARIQALLDWELCTLGDPLADLAYLMNNWAEPDTPGYEGYWSHAEICEHYAQLTGRDLGAIDYYRAFSHWRIGAINQGVYKRQLERGETPQAALDDKKASVLRRARSAVALLEV